MDELIIDNFAGGGGASTGIELATGRPVNIAVNHDPDAILMHKTNHPHTTHYQESVWDVDPQTVCGGKSVGLAWFSPDCKHFSKAKGKPLVNREIRGLSWVILRWGMENPPRVIIMENVEEIQTWGPLIQIKYADGQTAYTPDPARRGETFQGFIHMLTDGISPDHPALAEACEFLNIQPGSDKQLRLIRGLGYHVEYRELVAADYGTPTTRKRFVLIARCDESPIVWPKRTHAPADSDLVRNGTCKPWRSAAEIIDWSLPLYSVFASRQEIKDRYGVNAVRPLADNTLRRIIRGVDKFTIRSGDPFLVECNHIGDGHLFSTTEPLKTITAKCTLGVCESVIAPITFSNSGGSVGAGADSPIHTVTSDGKHVLAAAQLMQYHTEQSEAVRASDLREPVNTLDASNRDALVVASLTEYYGNGNPIPLTEPMRTVTSHDREALTAVHIVKFKGTNLGQKPAEPLQTVTASAGEFALSHVVLCKMDRRADYGNWPEIRKLLNRYCGYHINQDEILLLRIGRFYYYIRDILLRMLSPRELYRAMGFPEDYVIDRDYKGNVYGKTKCVARCGNAVCPPLAEALVRANYQSCPVSITSMDQLLFILCAQNKQNKSA